MQSWKEKLPGFEIVEWNESIIDIDEIAENNRFFKECKRRKLWAFMADYLRLKILYDYGGVYFDTDIQVLKDISRLLNRSILLGYEKDYKGDMQIGTGVIGCEKGNSIIKTCLDFYDQRIWNVPFYTIPRVLDYVFKGHPEVEILPYYTLTPFAFNDTFDISIVGDKTYTIHWFEGTWSSNLKVRTFLKTKHIHNPIKRANSKALEIVKYYVQKTLK